MVIQADPIDPTRKPASALAAPLHPRHPVTPRLIAFDFLHLILLNWGQALLCLDSTLLKIDKIDFN